MLSAAVCLCSLADVKLNGGSQDVAIVFDRLAV